jgi:hypothetical protein
MVSRAQRRSFAYEVFLSACAFTVFNFINLAFSSLISPEIDVSWIFLPAGACLMLTMIFPRSGPIGIGLSAFVMDYLLSFPEDLVTSLGVGLLTGISLYISRLAAIKHAHISPDLTNISITKIFFATLIFSAYSAVTLQSWYALRYLRIINFNEVWIEFLGNTSGTFLVLALLKITISAYMRIKRA